jgi:hypothetical protein
MFKLRRGTLNVLVGVAPPIERLQEVMHYAFDQLFCQTVVLSSQKLVQLCNFMRRCRNERAQGKRNEYLVLLHFLPHREAWDLLNKYQELGITLVLFGGVCTGWAIRELEQYSVHTVLEWYSGRELGQRPLLMGVTLDDTTLNGQTKGPVILYTTNTTFDAATELLVEQTYNTWLAARHPHNYLMTNFGSMADASNHKTHHQAHQHTHQHSHQHSHHTQSQRRQSPTAPATAASMTLIRACEILCISEAQSHNQREIRVAYRKRAIILHPDKNDDKEAAHTRFAELNEAKRYLDSLFS